MALVVAATVVLLVPGSLRLGAHDMPSDVHVQMFVRPSANRLQVLVRLPLISLLNINLPKRGENFLDLASIEPSLRDAAKATAEAVDLFEGGDKLPPPRVGAVQVSLPSDASFTSYETARAHIEGPPLPVGTEVVWNQGFFDTVLVYDIHSPPAGISLHPYFTALAPRVVSSVRFVLPDGSLRTFELQNDPGLVHLDPSWSQSAGTFIRAGTLEVLGGAELLLFLIALAIPIRRASAGWPVVAAFTIALTMTLVAGAFQVAPTGAWFPPVVATLTAIGIVCLTIDNVFIADQQHRWALAFGFGLAFGFALSFPLRQTLQLAGNHLAASVASFAVAVALVQVIVVSVFVRVLTALFRIAISERVGVIVVSALVCHTAWHWMVSRMMFLTTINWPLSDVIELMRWGIAATLMAAAAVVLVGFSRRFQLASRFSVHSTSS
jgi:hypothetical protein